MRTRILAIILITLWTFVAVAQHRGNYDDVYEDIKSDSVLVFRENFSNKTLGVRKLSVPARPLVQRVSNHSGNIEIQYDGYFPEEAMSCVDYAVSIWESMIYNEGTIVVTLKWESISDDLEVEVKPFDDINGTNISYPSSMWTTHNGGSNHGVITVNSSSIWNYSVTDVDNGGKNLTFMLLRAFCRIYGLYINIDVDESGDFKFTTGRRYAYIDNFIISSDSILLSSIPLKNGRANPELTSYVQEPDRKFYFTDYDGSPSDVEFASGPYSKENIPFAYLATGLMSKNITSRDYCLAVDDGVWFIMKRLGWELNDFFNGSSTPVIVSDELGEDDTTGLLDPYIGHSFHLSKQLPLEASNPTWCLTFQDRQSNDSITWSGKGDTCVIPEVYKWLSDDFRPNSDGLFKARLEFSFKVGRQTIKLRPYIINFECKPEILDARITEIVKSADGSRYKAKYTVRFRGGNQMEVFTEDEFSPVAETQYFYDIPYSISDETGWVTTSGYSWLKFRSSNSSGKGVYIIEVEPGAENWYPVDHPEWYLKPGQQTDIQQIEHDDNPASYDAFDIFGRLIWSGTSLDQLKSMVNTGIVILRKRGDERMSPFKLNL